MHLKRIIRPASILFATTLLSSCQSGVGVSPTAVAEVVASPVQSAVVPTQPDVNQPDVNVNPQAKELFDFEILSNDETWTLKLTNNSNSTSRVGVACYEDPDRNIDTQVYYASGTTRLGPGEADTASAEIPCGPWQCDGFTGDSIRAGAPRYGKRLIVGRIGIQEGGKCEPPPPPPPPPTCEELNPPSTSGWKWNKTSTHITAEFYCENETACSLKLWAGFNTHGREFTWLKDFASARIECGERTKLSVSYRYRGHSACLWTLQATGPGLSFDRVVLDRCEALDL